MNLDTNEFIWMWLNSFKCKWIHMNVNIFCCEWIVLFGSEWNYSHLSLDVNEFICGFIHSKIVCDKYEFVKIQINPFVVRNECIWIQMKSYSFKCKWIHLNVNTFCCEWIHSSWIVLFGCEWIHLDV